MNYFYLLSVVLVIDSSNFVSALTNNSINSNTTQKTTVKITVKTTVKVPIKAPLKAPVNVSGKAPVKVSVKAPVKAPVKATIKAPVKAPIKATTKATVKATVKTTIKSTVKATVKAPVKTTVNQSLSSKSVIKTDPKINSPTIEDDKTVSKAVNQSLFFLSVTKAATTSDSQINEETTTSLENITNLPETKIPTSDQPKIELHKEIKNDVETEINFRQNDNNDTIRTYHIDSQKLSSLIPSHSTTSSTTTTEEVPTTAETATTKALQVITTTERQQDVSKSISLLEYMDFKNSKVSTPFAEVTGLIDTVEMPLPISDVAKRVGYYMKSMDHQDEYTKKNKPALLVLDIFLESSTTQNVQNNTNINNNNLINDVTTNLNTNNNQNQKIVAAKRKSMGSVKPDKITLKTHLIFTNDSTGLDNSVLFNNIANQMSVANQRRYKKIQLSSGSNTAEDFFNEQSSDVELFKELPVYQARRHKKHRHRSYLNRRRADTSRHSKEIVKNASKHNIDDDHSKVRDLGSMANEILNEDIPHDGSSELENILRGDLKTVNNDLKVLDIEESIHGLTNPKILKTLNIVPSPKRRSNKNNDRKEHRQLRTQAKRPTNEDYRRNGNNPQSQAVRKNKKKASKSSLSLANIPKWKKPSLHRALDTIALK